LERASCAVGLIKEPMDVEENGAPLYDRGWQENLDN
jgi:hypothetical protein